jgi:uncharacterized protein (TIGR02284 family)
MAADTIDDLKTLHTHAVDARNGYEEALHDAEGRGMTPLFQDMIALHTTNADELSALLARLGQQPDQNGSFMTTIHRTIMRVRSLFGGLDASVVPGLIDGEKRNVSRYAETLENQDISADVRVLLAKQRHRIEAAIVAMDGVKACSDGAC